MLLGNLLEEKHAKERKSSSIYFTLKKLNAFILSFLLFQCSRNSGHAASSFMSFPVIHTGNKKHECCLEVLLFIARKSLLSGSHVTGIFHHWLGFCSYLC